VQTSDKERDVITVILCAIINMRRPYNSPVFPTTHPRRRYIITPRRVRTVGTYTPPKVPNFTEAEIEFFFFMSYDLLIPEKAVQFKPPD
jgi:hypothetical protein